MERVGGCAYEDGKRGGHRGAAGSRRWCRAIIAFQIAVLLGSALFAGGCGGKAAVAVADPPAQSTRLAPEQYAKMVQVFELLVQCGMLTWANYGWEFLDKGKILPIDFSSPDANQFHVSGLDAAANFADGNIYFDITMWRVMPPRFMATVMLDELAHFRYMTTDHTEYYKLHSQLVTAWESIYQRPWREYDPVEDEPYKEYWDYYFH